MMWIDKNYIKFFAFCVIMPLMIACAVQLREDGMTKEREYRCKDLKDEKYEKCMETRER